MKSQRSIELVLFFTRGVSLCIWDEAGILAREVALYQKLMERGAQVSFVTYGDKSDTALANRIPGIHVFNNRWNLPIEWYQRKLELFPPTGAVFKSNQIDGAEVALAAARRAGAKFVARCGYLLSAVETQTHGADSKQTQSARKLENEIFTQADWICVTTQAIALTVQEDYSVPVGKISIVPNYVDIDRFKPMPQSDAREKVRVGFVGRLAWEKNLEPLIDAAADLNVELLLAGEGPLKSQLAARAEAVKADAKFLGRISNLDLPQFLNSCDIFVLPSLYEGHPKALLEAMACGLAVIGTRVPGIRELLVDGDNGILCEPKADSLRQGIERVLENAPLRARLGQRARSYVQQHFALERIVELEFALLTKLVA